MQEGKNTANNMRKAILESCFQSGGHISTSMSCVEILVALYKGREDRFNLNQISQKDPNRDVFVMSKGHGENALYSLLIEIGLVPASWLHKHYRRNEYKLGGHVDSAVPGVEVSTGALGHGCSVACGIAKAKKMKGLDGRVFCLLGDAECSEGSVWESVIFAVNQKLSNLTFIIDNNKIGSLDFTENYIDFDRAHAFSGFGAAVSVVDGHNIEELVDTFFQDNHEFQVVVCETVKGKGVSAVENDPIWHVKKVDESVYETCQKEID